MQQAAPAPGIADDTEAALRFLQASKTHLKQSRANLMASEANNKQTIKNNETHKTLIELLAAIQMENQTKGKKICQWEQEVSDILKTQKEATEIQVQSNEAQTDANLRMSKINLQLSQMIEDFLSEAIGNNDRFLLSLAHAIQAEAILVQFKADILQSQAKEIQIIGDKERAEILESGAAVAASCVLAASVPSCCTHTKPSHVDL